MLIFIIMNACQALRKAAIICFAFAGLYLHGLKAFAQQLDTSIYAILPYTRETTWLFPAGSKPTSLSPGEIDLAERLLQDCIDKYNVDQQKEFERMKKRYPDARRRDYIIELSRYKRQYVCVINPKSEKVVWVNCMCCPFDPEWRKSISEMKDGGNCYFNLKIDLTNRRCFDLTVNGEA
jgi:hypothetical protein